MTEKTKAAPGHGAGYDLEQSVMKQCKNLLLKLNGKARVRVMAYLSDVATDPGDPPPPQLTTDPRQAGLFDNGKQTGPF